MKTFLPLSKFRYCKLIPIFMLFIFVCSSLKAQEDPCTGVTIIPVTSCGATNGTLPASATYSGVAGSCSTDDDIWYGFQATSPNPTITIGGSLGQRRIQLFSTVSTCSALTATAFGCAATLNPTGLTVGGFYFIRVYSNNGSTGNFTLCVQDPPPPANDNCSGAISLTSGSSCSNTTGTLTLATPSAVPTTCGNISSADVWYSYTATNRYPTITLSYAATSHANFRAYTPVVQLLSGAACGSLTEMQCTTSASGATSLTLTPNGAGLVIGTTYFIRVHTATPTGTVLLSNFDFQICLTNGSTSAPTVEWGKSYFNITKGTSGGTIEPGDILQMRATVIVKTNTAYNVSLAASVPANTTFVPGSMQVLTNEGKLYKQWTDAADGDPATVSGSTVTINAGTGASQTSGGMIKNSDRPTVFGSQALLVLAYQVQVNAVGYGVPISVGGGTLTYATGGGVVTNITFPTVTALTYRNTGICTNSIGSNGIISESGGTFGTGTTKDRAASTKVPSNYTYAAFTTGAPGDNFYGVSNNTSAGGTNYSINPTDPITSHRVFSVWDILGDHTGATNPLLGNPPANDAAHGGAGGGYMVVINAAYRTDTAFLDTVRNLCPNTSYEYSAWFRNICSKCSGDSTGKSPGDVGYVPTGPGDSSGVHPNLTFNVNGYDYYTTGDIMYTGQWIKKGFTYRTGPSETQLIINIRNNAPGGGGNDWAIDDIGVATCSPNLDVNPSTSTVNVCYADGFSLSAVVRSFFDNYNYYIWEVSSDNGTTFTNTTYSSAGTITPVLNGTNYEYTAPGPSFIGDSTTHGNIYRLRVASSSTNLIDPNCSFLASRTVQVYVNNCMWVLKTDLLGISGVLQNNMSRIQWQTANENEKARFEIEKSADGRNFTPIGKVQGNASALGSGNYTFTDPNSLKAAAYYRIKMYEGTEFKYSKIILLSPDKLFFEVKNLVNPFISNLNFDVITPADGEVRVTIYDNFGRMVKTYNERVNKGFSAIKIQNLNGLGSGTYAVSVQWQNETVTKRVIKLNN